MLEGTYAVPKKAAWTFVGLCLIDAINHNAATIVAALILIVCVIGLLLSAKWDRRKEE